MSIIPWNRDRSADWSLLPVLLAIALIVSAWPMQASALSQSRVLLFDGSIIVGDIVSYRSDAVTLNTSFNRELSIESSLIKDIEASAEDLSIATLLLKTAEKLRQRRFSLPVGCSHSLMAKSSNYLMSISLIPSPGKWGKATPRRVWRRSR